MGETCSHWSKKTQRESKATRLEARIANKRGKRGYERGGRKEQREENLKRRGEAVCAPFKKNRESTTLGRKEERNSERQSNNKGIHKEIGKKF